MESSNILNTILTTAPLVLFEQNPDGTFISMDAKIVDWTGYPSETWTSSQCRMEDILAEELQESTPSQTNLESATVGTTLRSFKCRHTHTGQIRSILEIKSPRFSEEGAPAGYTGFWWDLTLESKQRRRLHASLANDILRQLTSGFVHDLNNVFLGICSYTDLALSDLNNVQKLHGYLTHVKTNSNRAIEIVQRLSQLLTVKKARVEYHDLRTIATEATAILHTAIPRRIQLKTETGPDSLPIRGDANSLQQAVFALVLNAVDAIPNRGSIEIECSQKESVPKNLSLIGHRHSGPVGCLSIKDSGPGFTWGNPHETIRLQVSTKNRRSGLGMGLSLVGELIRSMGGGMSVASAKSSGTIIQCWLPLADMSENELALPLERTDPIQILLAVQSPEEGSRWKPRLLEAGIDSVIITRHPLLLLSDDLETYDAIAFPRSSSPSETVDWRTVIDQIRAQKYDLRIIHLTNEELESNEEKSTVSATDLVLSSTSSPESWKEKLGELRLSSPF